jgi:hypothetical protein
MANVDTLGKCINYPISRINEKRRKKMSADNGYIVRVHPKGGFAVVDYCASIVDEEGYDTPDGYPLVEGNPVIYPSIQTALDHDGYSEYGTHLDAEVKKIQKAALSELHVQLLLQDGIPNWNTKVYCSCDRTNGYTSKAELWKHQADALREQLKQLGG